MGEQKEITATEFIHIAKSWVRYIFTNYIIISIAAIICGIGGILYAWFQKPDYTAEITFASENDSKALLGSYSSMAAQFGFDLGAGSGSAFEGENLMHFMTSKLMIEKALLSPVIINGTKQLLIDYYIKVNEINTAWENDIVLRNISFLNFYETSNRGRDSIFKNISNNISNSLQIEKVDKKADIISVRFVNNSEFFAKLYVETLVYNVINYYTDYKSKKERQNVALLQKQTDSVKNLLTGNITEIAVSNDLNINPLRQITRTGIQKKQVDMQVNSTLYVELAKNLELSKMALRRQTPFIQIIDTPRMPLEKKKLGRLKGGILFGLVGAFVCIFYLVLKKVFS